MRTFTDSQRREYSLGRLRTSMEALYALPRVVDFIARDYAEDVERAIDRLESLPAVLPKNPSDLDLIVSLRAFVPGAYWAELARSKAADFMPLMRLLDAACARPALNKPAGAKPTLQKALSIIRAEVPRIEKDLVTITAATMFYSDREVVSELIGDDDMWWTRGRLWGEACQSSYFEEPLIRRAIDHFGDC